MTGDESVRGTPGFRVGDVVEVKSKEEILATLDENGEIDGLPFMPEMLQFCGQKVPVFKRAVKTCDPSGQSTFHRMHDTVHLQGLRCDGSAHDGCQARCLLFWREEWLRPVGESAASEAPTTPTVDKTAAQGGSGITEAELAGTTYVVDETGEKRYRCQMTESLRAAPETISDWDLSAWVRDLRSGNAGLGAALRAFLVALFNGFQRVNRKVLPRVPLVHGAQPYPFIAGRLTKTPRQTLDLQPGELVRVKSREEIEATLDTKGHNRGMAFDRNMVRFCGREARVIGRVDRFIDEKTGRMRELANDCVILEDVYCEKRLCPRAIYTYWREIWLERVEPGEEPVRSLSADVGACAD